MLKKISWLILPRFWKLTKIDSSNRILIVKICCDSICKPDQQNINDLHHHHRCQMISFRYPHKHTRWVLLVNSWVLRYQVLHGDYCRCLMMTVGFFQRLKIYDNVNKKIIKLWKRSIFGCSTGIQEDFTLTFEILQNLKIWRLFEFRHVSR